MKQILLPINYNGEKVFTLSKDDSHYILRVHRNVIGNILDFVDQGGNKYSGTIIDTIDNCCLISLKKYDTKKCNNYTIILFQSIPKGKKFDLIIRQAVEIGVTKIYPIMAEHSIPTFKTGVEREKKRERWSKIVKDASQQSGTSQITSIEKLQTFKNAIEDLDKDFTGLFFHQVPLEENPIHQSLSDPKKTIVLIVGPEGGLSPGEVELFKKNNFIPTHLGENILRTQTATIFALGAVKMILLEKENWIPSE